MGALDRVAGAGIVVWARDVLVGVLVVAVLAADSAQHAVLSEVLLDVLPHHGLATLVDAEDGLIGTALGGMQVRLDSAHLPTPFAASFVVGAVYLEQINPLLKVLVFEVVECRRVAVGACGVDGDATLNAGLAVMVATADDLHWLSQHSGTQLAHQLWRNLADKVEGIAIVFELGTGIHVHYLYSKQNH